MYTRDANKRRTAATDTRVTGNNRTYTYDDEDRLTGFTRSNGDAQSWNLSLVATGTRSRGDKGTRQTTQF